MRTIAQTLSPVYFFYGTETFLIEEKIASICQKIGLDAEGLGKIVIDLAETPIQELVIEAQTVSLFRQQRVIIGKNAEFLSTGKSHVKHQVESLIRYLDHPVESTVVILTLSTDKLDRRKKVGKELLKKAKVEKCDPLSGKELVYWLRQRFQRASVSIEDEGLRELILQVGNDLRQLDQECQKLATYVGKNGKVTPQEIHWLVPRTLEQDVFKLINQLATRNRAEALCIWSDLLFQKEEPIRILALMIRQLRLILYAKILSAKGKSKKEMASLLKVHPYPLSLAINQGKAFSKKELTDYLAKAIEIDQKIKSGKGEKQVLIEQLLLNW